MLIIFRMLQNIFSCYLTNFFFKKIDENFILLRNFFFQNLFLSESSRNQIKKISTFKYLLVVYICSQQKNLILANRFNRVIQLYKLKISFLVYILVLSNRTAMHKHFYRTESDFFVCLS